MTVFYWVIAVTDTAVLSGHNRPYQIFAAIMEQTEIRGDYCSLCV